jgi:hypothetical protein
VVPEAESYKNISGMLTNPGVHNLGTSKEKTTHYNIIRC